MKKEFEEKLNDWYKGTLPRYEVLRETDNDVLIFIACRSNKKLLFDIVRIFTIGNTVHISVDKTVEGDLNMDKVLELIQTAIRF